MITISTEQMDKLFKEMIDCIINRGVDIPINFPEGEGWEYLKEHYYNDSLSTRNLGGDNKIGVCPSTKNILEILGDVFGLDLEKLLKDPHSRLNQRFCGVSHSITNLDDR